MCPFSHLDNNFKVMIESIFGKGYNPNVLSFKGIYKKIMLNIGISNITKIFMLGGESQ